ncbi:MarR family transcriptional regulator [Nonomuraea diastatica]|uniref:MarR family transcriptional regulator n=1 Tax=Nonomuraea diastatica TaxID=1848329 RepID=A0A4R4WV82_9ACTN|nr:MarR family transcriptional regulator [Nonomuraea diastatica]TDD21596.1 MarR family transcriptional regulator [Nonomuraea diastatica]
MGDTADQRSWTFFTNHTRVLVMVALDPQIRIRDLADTIGITERAAQGILTDLHEAGYVRRMRRGRRNHYAITPDTHLRHPRESTITVQTLLNLFAEHSPHDDTAQGPAVPTPRTSAHTPRSRTV